MNRNILLIAVILVNCLAGFSQTDKDQLALDISKVDAENIEKLKAYIWKFHANVMGEGGNKTNIISEFSFKEDGSININVVDGETNIKQKRGVRGKMQQSAMQDKMEYVGKAMEYALAYTYMTKGQLLDFFDKAEIYEKEGVIMAEGSDIYVKGDNLKIHLDPDTKLYLSKSFRSKLGEDPISGEVKYETFQSSGVNHISTTLLEMPAENIKIEGENKDYTIRVD